MSMTILTIYQLITLFIVYIVMTLFLPAAVFHKKLVGHCFCVRFMIYFLIGNFYIINLVYILQLLKIANGYTLWIVTLLLAAVVGLWINNLSVKNMFKVVWQYVNRIIQGSMGIKTFLRRMLKFTIRMIRKVVSWIRKRSRGHMLEGLCLFGLLGYLFWIYGSNAITTYGYCSSDIPVHNYWINGMKDNEIFIAGVYPFGFHCIIYYFHTCFGIDTYILLRLFCLVQTVFIHLMLIAFIKALTKTSFAVYIGVGIYIAIGIFEPDCTNRFFSALPQEFGMAFILPAIYFAFAFFTERKKEVDSEEKVTKSIKRENKKKYKDYLRTLRLVQRSRLYIKKINASTWNLVIYTMSFSLTLTIHFYDTLIVGLFCLAIALAFYKQFFHRRYLGRIMVGFFLGIIIALLPLAIAFASGTPLEPSLKWGVNVIKGTENDGKLELNAESQTPVVKDTEEEILEEDIEMDMPIHREMTLEEWIGYKISQAFDTVKGFAYDIYDSFNYMLNTAVFLSKDRDYMRIILLCMLWILVWSLLSFVRKKEEYGGRLLAVLFYIGFLLLLLATGPLGLPVLLDSNRCRIFLVYSLPILWSFMADAPLYVLFDGYKGRRFIYRASLITCSILAIAIGACLPLRKPGIVKGLETNQAITCLTNIIYENKDLSWTIVSANDETQMVVGRGFHTEIIEFLKTMEYTGHRGALFIPTRYVYFFIEKIPIDYPVPYENSGQSISEKGASKSLPLGTDLGVYQTENRWIVMSKMYYWAKAYQELYPNEMKVYLEDDEFICYRIEQNDYSLNNFAIDYGFNLPEE